MIQIHKATDRIFNKPLVNCIPKKAMLAKDDDGDYYLDVEIPFDKKTPHGISIDYLPYLVQDNIVYCETPWGKQPFRLNNITYTGTTAKSRAYHVGLDSKRFVLISANLENVNLTTALTTVLAQAGASADFTYTVSASNKLNTETLILGATTLYEAIKIIAKTWGVQISFDKWHVTLRDYPTTQLNELIQSGYNLKSMEMTENWDGVGNDVLFAGYRNVNYGAKIDLRNSLQNPLLIREIRYDGIVKLEPTPGWDTSSDALIQMDLHNQSINYPFTAEMLKINYAINADIKAPTDVGDIIPVKHSRLGVDILTKVISLEYDTLTQRYKKVEFGNFKPRIKGLAVNINTDMQNLKTRLEKGGL